MKDDRLTDAQIETAVEWWGEQLSSPKFDTLPQDRKDDPAAFAETLATMTSKPKSAEMIAEFKDALRILLRGNRAIRVLSVDYGPDRWLSMAASASGFPTGMTDWPWKTTMWLWDGKVDVRRGYGAEVETLLEAE